MSFASGQIVKNLETVYGEVVEYNPQLTNQEPTVNPGKDGPPGARAGETVEIPPGFTGEVLSSDNITTVAIYPIHSTGALEPHLIKVTDFTAAFKAVVRHNPFVWERKQRDVKDPGRPITGSSDNETYRNYVRFLQNQLRRQEISEEEFWRQMNELDSVKLEDSRYDSVGMQFLPTEEEGTYSPRDDYDDWKFRQERREGILDKWQPVSKVAIRQLPQGDAWLEAWGKEESSSWPELDKVILEAAAYKAANVPYDAIIQQARAMLEPVKRQRFEQKGQMYRDSIGGVKQYTRDEFAEINRVDAILEAYKQTIDMLANPDADISNVINVANSASAWLWITLAKEYQGYQDPTNDLFTYTHEDAKEMVTEDIMPYIDSAETDSGYLYGTLEELETYLTEHKDLYGYEPQSILKWAQYDEWDKVKAICEAVLQTTNEGMAAGISGDDWDVDRRLKIRQQQGVGERTQDGKLKWTKVASEVSEEEIAAYNVLRKTIDRAYLYWSDKIYKAKQMKQDTTALEASRTKSIARLRKLTENSPIDPYLKQRWLKTIDGVLNGGDTQDLYGLGMEMDYAAGKGVYQSGIGFEGVANYLNDINQNTGHGAEYDDLVNERNRLNTMDKWNVGERTPDGKLKWAAWTKAAAYKEDDPLDEPGLRAVIDEQEVPWWTMDRAQREQAIANALRVGMLSPLKILKFNAVHYQDISRIPGNETDPQVYIDTLKGHKQKWDAAGQTDLFSNPEEVEPHDPENSEKYAGFIHKHLQYIANVSAHISELTDAAEADVQQGGQGYIWRDAINSINLPGVNNKVAAFAWLLLAPKTSELATIDSHMMRALGADERMSQNPEGYKQLEKEMRIAKDNTGYGHMPLGMYQWGVWDYMRTPPDDDGYHHQSHASMKVLDPVPYKNIKWHKPINNSPIYGERAERTDLDWWQMTEAQRMEARREYEEGKRRVLPPPAPLTNEQPLQPQLFARRQNGTN